jgi:acetylornithine deacetylase
VLDIVRRASADVLDEAVAGLRQGVRKQSINPSVPGGSGEGEFQQFLAGLLDDLGCRIEAWEPDADALADRFPGIRPLLGAAGFVGRPNVIAWVPAEEAPDGTRAHVILNSHADTVGLGEVSAWPHPPFDAALADGAVWGRGSVDAKGCLLAFVGAVSALRRAGVRLRRNVMIQSVVDEEWAGAGTLECVRRGYLGSAAVVGEPTALDVCPGSRGSMTLSLRVMGRRAHPGEGWRGVNAIRKAWLYVQALDRLRDLLDRTQMHPLWAGLPAGHVWNLMGIGSAADGRGVPDACEIQYGVGLIGEERTAQMRARVEAALAEVTAADPWLTAHPPQIGWRDWAFEPAITDVSHPAVAALAAARRDMVGSDVLVRAFSAGSDSRHLTNSGGVPAINFGPGELHLGHSPLEALPVEDLRQAIETIALFLARHCGGYR